MFFKLIINFKNSSFLVFCLDGEIFEVVVSALILNKQSQVHSFFVFF
jgi:hypothetical protein